MALLTVAASLQCPHGGTVSIMSSNSKVTAGAPIALATDTFTIAGCPFQIPVGVGTVPHPCVKVQWTKVDAKSLIGGVPTVSQDSTGICLAADGAPQGQVSVLSTPSKASGS